MQYMKLRTSGLLLASFLLLLNGCGPAVPDALAPDLVLHNGKIVTVDEDFSIAQAVAIKDGRKVCLYQPEPGSGPGSEILSVSGPDFLFELGLTFFREAKDETDQCFMGGICNGNAFNNCSFSR